MKTTAAPITLPAHSVAPAAPVAVPSTDNVRRLASDDLFAGAAEVHIEHGEAVYRLKRTALGKLILTK